MQHCTRKSHVPNVGPWPTDNVYVENNVYNAVSTMLGQHCIRILSSQCCSKTPEATLLKKITYAMLTQSAQTCFFQKNNLCNVVLIYLSQHCTRNYLYNVGLQPITTLHRKIICNVDLSYVREHCAKKLPRIYPSNFDVRWMAKKKNLPIEFSNSIFIKFCFKAYWHWTYI